MYELYILVSFNDFIIFCWKLDIFVNILAAVGTGLSAPSCVVVICLLFNACLHSFSEVYHPSAPIAHSPLTVLIL